MSPRALLIAAAAVAVGILLAGSPPARAASELPSELERGDEAWARRAEGFLEHGAPDRSAAAEAVSHYTAAVAEAPDDLDRRFKLVEALYFQGHFAATDSQQRRELVDRQLAESEAILDLVTTESGGRAALSQRSPAEQATLLRGAPGAAEAHFWAAISQGVWAMEHGNLAAARRGVAARIREHAETLIALDPDFAEAGGLRLLGRLHTATPRVPLFTGWIDRREGIELLERACGVSTRDARNPLFLAEALLRFEPTRRDEALEILRDVVDRSPRPSALVEDSEVLAQARRLLAESVAGAPGAHPDEETRP